MATLLASQPQPLKNLGIIVTRPAAQAHELCHQLGLQGARTLRFPSLAIEPLSTPNPAQRIAQRLSDYRWALFISANAVEHGLDLIKQSGTVLPAAPSPADIRLGVIGKASAQKLSDLLDGRPPDLMPASGFDSEALLALPEMQAVAGQRIVIFRGQGGRGLLADTLRARGASVDYADVYRRIQPTLDPTPLLRAWQRSAIFAATTTSNESLNNLYTMVGERGQRWLRQTALVVVSERGRAFAKTLGFEAPIILAENASAKAITDAVLKLAARYPPSPA